MLSKPPKTLVRIALAVAVFWLTVIVLIGMARAETPPLDEYFTIQRTEWKSIALAQTPNLAYPVLIWVNGLKLRAQTDYYTTTATPKVYTFRATKAGDKVEVIYWPPASDATIARDGFAAVTRLLEGERTFCVSH